MAWQFQCKGLEKRFSYFFWYLLIWFGIEKQWFPKHFHYLKHLKEINFQMKIILLGSRLKYILQFNSSLRSSMPQFGRLLQSNDWSIQYWNVGFLQPPFSWSKHFFVSWHKNSSHFPVSIHYTPFLSIVCFFNKRYKSKYGNNNTSEKFSHKTIQ